MVFSDAVYFHFSQYFTSSMFLVSFSDHHRILSRILMRARLLFEFPQHLRFCCS